MAAEVSFGAWVAQRRKALDLTREQLAERVGCSVSRLRKIESDERRPSRQIAELLAERLDIPADLRSTFLQVARGQLRVERLGPATGASATSAKPTTSRPSSNLPIPPTPLVGREPELAALTQLLGDPQCRLITLIGPGGVGKTHLALEFASTQHSRFPGGVCYVALASLNSPEFIVKALANAFGLSFSGPSELKVQLFNYLRDKSLLLVLDNLEHLMGGAGLLAEMLERAPQVTLLVTSRGRLNLRAEWVLEIQGLPVPPTDRIERAQEYSAVTLFVQSAQRAQPNLKLDERNWTAVARICRLVEGMPLGIELAAAWVRLLSCQEIASA